MVLRRSKSGSSILGRSLEIHEQRATGAGVTHEPRAFNLPLNMPMQIPKKEITARLKFEASVWLCRLN